MNITYRMLYNGAVAEKEKGVKTIDVGCENT
jgi:hypothetical protein